MPTVESSASPAEDRHSPAMSGRRGPKRVTSQAIGPIDSTASSSVWGRKASPVVSALKPRIRSR